MHISRASRGPQRDPLIGLGTAPLEDSQFRSAVFEQLGESHKLEGALTTDITGKKDSHAIRLDHEAEETLKKARNTQEGSHCGSSSSPTGDRPEIRQRFRRYALVLQNLTSMSVTWRPLWRP